MNERNPTMYTYINKHDYEWKKNCKKSSVEIGITMTTMNKKL